MRKGCKLYAILVLNEKGVVEGLEHLPVVKEFADVFPEEWPRMPPERELELLDIVYALKVWRHYLVGRKFELRTDHCGLQHNFTQSDLNARQRRWSELLSEYDFEISYL
jgi:hypothetical protein